MWSPDIMSWAYKLKALGFNEAMKATDDNNLKEELYRDYEKASVRLTSHNAKYNDFCTNNGLKRLPDRVNTARWNRTEAMKSVKATKRIENFSKVYYNKIVGVPITSNGEISTYKFKIHHRKTGTHIVPYSSEKDGKRIV